MPEITACKIDNSKRTSCLWAQAGIVRKKECRINYLCTECHFDRVMKHVARENRELKLSGKKPNYMIHTTLGQIWLLRGKHDLAQKCFREALKSGTESKDYIQNAVVGLGNVLLRQGRYEEALNKFEDALDLMKGDASAQVAIAETHLRRKDAKTALECAEEAQWTGKFGKGIRIRENFVASAYLMCARIQVEREDFSETEKYLYKLEYTAVHSPRDLSLASLLAAANSDSEKGKIFFSRFPVSLSKKASIDSNFDGMTSPICLSALGAAKYTEEDYLGAISFFKKAMAEREKWWPHDVRAFHSMDDARDLYFMAMAHLKLTNDSNTAESHESEARLCYKKAEEIFQRKKNLPYIDYEDIAVRIRTRAKEALDKHQGR